MKPTEALFRQMIELMLMGILEKTKARLSEDQLRRMAATLEMLRPALWTAKDVYYALKVQHDRLCLQVDIPPWE